MNLAIFGLGYVGTVSMACFARDGHHVIGVDVNPNKINSIREGKSPIIEPGLGELIQAGISNGHIQATMDVAEAVARSEVFLITVGTPSLPNGSLDTAYVIRVCQAIGRELAHKDAYNVVAIRSTVLPGTAKEIFLPELEKASGKVAGGDFGFCLNPEFLREGSAINDFDHPPYTVIGEYDDRSGQYLANLYALIDAPLYRVPLGAAEMVKYASNAFHALKVTFANEIGNICKAHGVDSHHVMRIFVKDAQLNLSPYYLKPGFSFGGSCLGKDLRALLYTARQRDIPVPILAGIIPSNSRQTEKAVEMVLREEKRKVGMIGLSFKSNTDDLRESPALELAERLIGKGIELKIYDREVSLSQIYGSNKEYIEKALPHIHSIMRESLEEVVGASELIVVTKRLSASEGQQLLDALQPGQILVDLVRLEASLVERMEGVYRGICW